MTTLYVISGPDIGRSLEFKGEAISIGRAPENDIQIRDRFVSRRHVELLRRGDKFFIKDLESKNGTFLDGNLIRPGVEVELMEGIPVVIGMSVICLGEGCSKDVLAFLNSMELPAHVKERSSAHAHERPMTARKNMELIRNVSEVFSESLNVGEILDKILDYIFDLFKRIDRGAIIVLDRETGEISEVVTRVKENISDQVARYCQDIVDQVIEEGKGIIVTDTEAEAESEFPDTLKMMKIKSVMCVPLISKSHVRGVIYVDSITKPYGFRREDFALFDALSVPATNAMENAVLYAKRRGGGGA